MTPQSFAVLFVVVAFLAPLVGVLFLRVQWGLQDRAENIRNETRDRIAKGLPPHSRCVCDECAAWRSVPANLERMHA